MSATTGRAELARAALEGIAFRVREVVEATEAAMGSSAGEVRVDGGLSASDALMQIQADALQRPVVRPADVETTARGAALLAGMAAGGVGRVAGAGGGWRAPVQAGARFGGGVRALAGGAGGVGEVGGQRGGELVR